jgi:hypothetical protein
MRALRLLVFVVVGLGSVVALLVLLPWLKEGFGVEDLPLFAAILAALVAAAAVWWAMNRRSRGALFVLGLLALGPPLLAYAGLTTRLVANHWRGRRLERTVRILSLRETEIRWPGVDGPVGVRLELELEHAVGLEGNLFQPKVVMGSDPRPRAGDYFFRVAAHGIDRTLEAPVLETAQTPPRDVLARPGRVRLTFDLFSSALQRRDGPAACLAQYPPPRAPGRLALGGGSDLGAAWMFAARGGVIVDLGSALTDALRLGSALQGRPDEWRRMIDRLEPASLEAAGYHRCTPVRPSSLEICYCPR